MSDGQLTPERAVRLLRAKGGELENKVLHNARYQEEPSFDWSLTADVALLFQLLADHIERTELPLPPATQQRLAPGG